MIRQIITIHGEDYRFNKVVSRGDTSSEAADAMQVIRSQLSRSEQDDRAYVTYKMNGVWCGCEYIVIY